MEVKRTLSLLFQQVWYIGWTILTLLSFYFSMVGGYAYVVFVGVIVGISQTVVLGWLKETKYAGLWLINSFVWGYITHSYQGDENFDQFLWLLPVLLLPLNEVILWIIFRRSSRFIWTGLNLLAYGYIYLIYKGADLLIPLELQYNDAIQVVLMFIALAPYSIISGYAIYLAYIKLHHTTTALR
ncbi:hypothetical protein [Pontibacter ruber]|uniref:Uncharacterized protein n=1 Tax=Pontibacter ruber TaxID=1343895 RepID=A0ABW5CT53_9BACT|nr:hypothetical protein [Pontibacter ruber]